MVVVTNDPYANENEPMLGGASSQEIPQVAIRRGSCTDEAYKNVIGSMNSEKLKIADPKVACQLLSTAVVLQNKPLAQQCIQNLEKNLDKANVLAVYIHLSQLKNAGRDPEDFTPSAPPIVETEEERTDNWADGLTDTLTHKCLQTIDKNAEFVLRQREIMDLDYFHLLTILKRDTLEVQRETVVYAIVVKWARCECERRGLQPYPVNIKAVVRELRHAPRYGLMTSGEFNSKKINGERGPKHSYILDKEEWKDISHYIKERSRNRAVMELGHNMSRPRIRSEERHCTLNTTCDKFLMNFLICWATVFD